MVTYQKMDITDIKFTAGKPVDVDQNGLSLYFLGREGARGTERSIYADDEDNIVMKGLPHPDEYVFEKDYRTIQEIFSRPDIKVYPSREGTTIHVFYYKDRWYTSTHKRLDAFKSYWADNKNRFGASFARGLMRVLPEDVDDDENLENFLTKVYNKYLNKELKYTFLLPPIFSERVGSKPVVSWPKPVNVMVRNRDFVVLEDCPTFPGMFLDNLCWSTNEFMRKLIHCNPDYMQGFYARVRESSLQIKFYTGRYYDRVLIRNNTANLKFRYMFVRSAKNTPKNKNEWDMFVKTYPEFDWEERENEISRVCEDIVKLTYGDSTRVPRFEFEEVCQTLRRLRRRINYQNLMGLSYSAPVIFNRLLNRRRRAVAEMRETEENDLLEKMSTLDELD